MIKKRLIVFIAMMFISVFPFFLEVDAEITMYTDPETGMKSFYDDGNEIVANEAEETGEKSYSVDMSDEVERQTYRNPRQRLYSSDGTLYSQVPADQSIYGQPVCIYVTNSGSQNYIDAVNAERSVWGVPAIGHTQDLDEGAMLRAGEAMEFYVRGQHSQRLDHSTVEYNLGPWESLVARQTYNPLDGYDFYMTEKAYLPGDFTPYKYTYKYDNNGQVIGHYVTMVSPSILYAGQGVAFEDIGCDGVGDDMIIAEEHSTTANDVYPDFNQEISKNLGTSTTATNIQAVQETAPAPSTATSTPTASTEQTTDQTDTTVEKTDTEEDTDTKAKKNTEEKEKTQKKETQSEKSTKKTIDTKKQENNFDPDDVLVSAGRSVVVEVAMMIIVASIMYFIVVGVIYLRRRER